MGVGVGNALCLASERPADYNASITLLTSILSSPTPQPSRDAHDGREQGDAHPRPSVKELEPRSAITRDACSVHWPFQGFPLAPYLVSFPCFLLVSLEHPLVSWGNSVEIINQFPARALSTED